MSHSDPPGKVNWERSSGVTLICGEAVGIEWVAGDGGVAHDEMNGAGDDGVDELQEPDVLEEESGAWKAGTEAACTMDPSPPADDMMWLPW